MTAVRLPDGFRLERLARAHPRKTFASGRSPVDDWFATKALQHQGKRLSVTKVLVDDTGTTAGFYTLATGQVDFTDLPPDVAKGLPRRLLPVAVLAWLGVATDRQGTGLGRLLLAAALRDGYDAGRTFAFVAVILDCLDDTARAFYQRFDFAPLPGYPYRLFVTGRHLETMMVNDRTRP